MGLDIPSVSSDVRLSSSNIAQPVLITKTMGQYYSYSYLLRSERTATTECKAQLSSLFVLGTRHIYRTSKCSATACELKIAAQSQTETQL